MLRIALVIESPEARWGGTTTAFLSILDAIATRPDQLEASCYFLRPGEQDVVWERIRRDPGRFKLADSRGWACGPGALGRMLAADLRAGMIDVLHLQGLWCPDLVHAANVARRVDVPVLWQPHGMLLRSAMNYKRLKKLVFLQLGLGRALKRASGFIVETRDGLKSSVFPASCPPDRRFLVGYPISLPTTLPDRAKLGSAGRERFGLPSDAFVLAFLGRLHPVKRVDMTIAAFARAVSERAGATAGVAGSSSLDSARLLVLGRGKPEYEDMLKRHAASLGVADRVVFSGWIDDDTKLKGLAASDAFVLNSSIESFGYVLFEAIGVGTPPVVSSNLSLATELRDQHVAVCAENSIDGVAAGMRHMASLTAAERAAMVDRGFAWAKRDFSLSSIGRKLEETYLQVAGKPVGPR